jgi:hypothetical protein
MADGAEAVDALLAGECDLVDPNAVQDVSLYRMAELQQQGKLSACSSPTLLGADLVRDCWMTRACFFASQEVRQAFALHRPPGSEEQLFQANQVAQAYIPSANPL